MTISAVSQAPVTSAIWYQLLRVLPRGPRFRLARRSPDVTRKVVRLRLREDIVMNLDLEELLQRLIAADCYERAEEDVIRRLLGPGDCVVDVGANIGYNALRYARLVGPGGRVIAFEPAPPNFDALRENVALNPGLRVEPQHLALGASAGTVHLASDRAGQTSAGYSIMNRSPGGFDVEQRALDEWAREKGLHSVRLVKIDVEGLEAEVLQGAAETITLHRPFLLIEWNRGHERTEALGRELSGLSRLGYETFLIARRRGSGRGVLSTLPQEFRVWPAFGNIVMCPSAL